MCACDFVIFSHSIFDIQSSHHIFELFPSRHHFPSKRILFSPRATDNHPVSAWCVLSHLWFVRHSLSCDIWSISHHLFQTVIPPHAINSDPKRSLLPSSDGQSSSKYFIGGCDSCLFPIRYSIISQSFLTWIANKSLLPSGYYSHRAFMKNSPVQLVISVGCRQQGSHPWAIDACIIVNQCMVPCVVLFLPRGE